MKKIIIVALSVFLLLSMTACGSKEGKEKLANQVIILENENQSLKEEIKLLKADNEDKSSKSLTFKNELDRLKLELKQSSIKNVETQSSELELEVLIEEYFLDGEISFSIETNLPNDTEAIMSLEGNDDYIAQDKVIIYGGRATTAYFSDQHKPLQKGNYTIEFLLPHSQSQPDDVQKILGNDYKNVLSDKKEKGKYGVTISVIKEINID